MIALIHGRIRPEERLLLDAAQRLGIDVTPVHDSQIHIDLDGHIHTPDGPMQADAALIRSISTSRGLTIARACQAAGIPVFNNPDTAATCADKSSTSWALHAAGVPTPETRVAFTPETTLEALDLIGYPAVLKPVTGSWARMVAQVRDRREAEQLLEHREMLPNPQQHIYYVQQWIDTRRGDQYRDIRAFVVGDQVIAAIHRTSPSWITNTARGATTSAVPLTPELTDICQRAARAVGGGILAIDLMEGPDGLLVHEVNHTMEFRNSIDITGVDIPGLMLQHIQASIAPNLVTAAVW